MFIFLSFHKEIIGINEIMNRYWETRIFDRVFFFFWRKRTSFKSEIILNMNRVIIVWNL